MGNRNKKTDITPELLAKWIHEDGETIQHIADKLGKHRSSIYKWINVYRLTHPELFPFGSRTKEPLSKRFPIEVAMKEWGTIPTDELAYRYDARPEDMYQLITKYRKMRPDAFISPFDKDVSPYELENKTINEVKKRTNRSIPHIKKQRRKYHMQRKTLSSYLDEKTLQEMLDDGQTISQIATMYGQTYQTVYNLALQYNVRMPKKTRKNYKRLTREQKELIFRLRDDGKKPIEIAQVTGLDIKTIQNQLSTKKGKRSYVQLRLSRPLLENEYVIKGRSTKQIANRYNLSIEEVEKHIKRYSLEQ